MSNFNVLRFKQTKGLSSGRFGHRPALDFLTCVLRDDIELIVFETPLEDGSSVSHPFKFKRASWVCDTFVVTLTGSYIGSYVDEREDKLIHFDVGLELQDDLSSFEMTHVVAPFVDDVEGDFGRELFHDALHEGTCLTDRMVGSLVSACLMVRNSPYNVNSGRSIAVDELKIGKRAVNSLIAEELETLGDVEDAGMVGLLKIPGFGMKSLKEVRAALNDFGITLSRRGLPR